jgi:hypothetical protein
MQHKLIAGLALSPACTALARMIAVNVADRYDSSRWGPDRPRVIEGSSRKQCRLTPL